MKDLDDSLPRPVAGPSGNAQQKRRRRDQPRRGNFQFTQELKRQYYDAQLDCFGERLQRTSKRIGGEDVSRASPPSFSSLHHRYRYASSGLFRRAKRRPKSHSSMMSPRRRSWKRVTSLSSSRVSISGGMGFFAPRPLAFSIRSRTRSARP